MFELRKFPLVKISICLATTGVNIERVRQFRIGHWEDLLAFGAWIRFDCCLSFLGISDQLEITSEFLVSFAFGTVHFEEWDGVEVC